MSFTDELYAALREMLIEHRVNVLGWPRWAALVDVDTL
jgi:hypothetical protein